MAGKASLIIKLKLPRKAPNPRKRKQSQAQIDNDVLSRPLAPRTNTTPDGPPSQAPIFTQGQLALALALQKSKPLELSTKDYILQLRKHIKLGREGEEQHRYVDTAEFWKDQYDKILGEKRAWEAKAKSLVGDRERGEEIVVDEEGWDVDVRALEYKPFSCITLLRQTQSLSKLLTDANIDAPTMLISLQTTLFQMNSLIAHVCEQKAQLTLEEDNRTLKREHIEEAIRTVGLSYHQCLRGFNHLCRDIPGRQNKNIAVHGFSKFFSHVLGHVHKMCEASVEHWKQLERSKTPGQGERNRANSAGSSTRYDVTNMCLSKLLVIMITSHDLNEHSPGHIDILEGYLFHLLQDTGTTLSEIVFLEQVSPETSSAYQTTDDPQTRTEPNPVAQTKARYLVFILREIIKNNPKVSQMLNDMPQKAAFTRSNTRSKKSVEKTGKGQLSVDARMKLQHTLMKSVFGGDNFSSSFKAPAEPEYEIDTSMIEEGAAVAQFSSEWFVESLWSLIGWDVLSGVK